VRDKGRGGVGVSNFGFLLGDGGVKEA